MSRRLWIFEWGDEKEKRWVEMRMLVGKRWRVFDGSNYIWKKGNKVESTQANRAFFFYLEEANRESKNLWVIPGNVAHCSKFVIHFF